MQLIAEAYDLLKNGAGPDQRRAARRLYAVERGRPGLVPDRDHRPDLRPQGRPEAATATSWTTCWTRPPRRAPASGPSQSALDLGIPVTAITEAVFARSLSALKDQRVAASKVLPGPTGGKIEGDRQAFIDDVRDALYASKVVAYAQGFEQMLAAAKEYGWTLHPGEIATIWRGGCIIRARFLDRIKDAYDQQPDLREPAAGPLLHRGGQERPGRLAPRRRRGRPAGHPHPRLLVRPGLLRRLPPRAPARQPDPGPARPVRRAHLRAHGQARRLPLAVGWRRSRSRRTRPSTASRRRTES